MTEQTSADSIPGRRTSAHGKSAWVIPTILCLIFIAQCGWFIGTQSLVIDEPYHLVAGLDAWRNHRFRWWDDHPPLARMWLTLPLRDAKWQLDVESLRQALPANVNDAEPMARRARSMNVILGLALGWVLWFTTRRMFSTGAANLALALFVLSPAIVAHFSLATTDGAATLFIFATAAYLLRWRRDPSIRRTVTLGILLGLLLLAKFSTPPMFLLAAGWMLVSKREGFAVHPRQWNWGKTCGAASIALLLVWAGYFFHVSHVTVRDGVFTAAMPNRPPIISRAPKNLNVSLAIPAGEYIEGLRLVMRHNIGGHGSFLLGQISEHGGFKLYFPVVILVKWPTITLLFLAAGVFLAARRSVPAHLEAWILASFPTVYFAFAVFSRINIGDRHILPIYPFALLFTGMVWEFASPRRAMVIAIALALTLQAADTLRYAPDYLSYFAPFVAPSESYKVLVDSNLDWGQGLLALREYERAHPDETTWLSYLGSVSPKVYGIRAQPLPEGQHVSGTVVVSATYLSVKPDAYQWLVQFPRTQILNHSLHVFRVPAGQP